MMAVCLKYIRTWWPTATVVAVILYATMSHDPVGDTNLTLIPGIDKLIHAIMFGGLYASLAFDRRRSGRPLTSTYTRAYAIAAIAFGAAIEGVQAMANNGRAAEFADWIADTAGVAIAVPTANYVINKIFADKN